MSIKLVDACCELPPTASEYKPVGEQIKVGNLSVYVTGEKGKVICIRSTYDMGKIFLARISLLSSMFSTFTGTTTVLLAGNPYPLDEPIQFPKLMALIAKEASDESIYRDTEAVMAYLKKEEGTSVSGVIGMCWGAQICVKLAIRYHEIKAVASPHPSFVTPASVTHLGVPLYLIVTKDDAPHVDVIEAMKRKGGDAEKYSHVSSYPDVHHGFMSARWEETSELNNKRATEGTNEFGTFFKKAILAKI
ncbi:hypothetical protein BJ742DRAFT_873867 [Cladochytrium replicatum]|nr:hypothetical protein BJ742DRAFT_873867 [Cladochytrium replicatum]